MTQETAIAMEKFSKDHWSTFAYIETLCVDGKNGVGTIARGRMRCNENRHPLLHSGAPGNKWNPEWGTRLTGYFESPDRSDHEKIVAAGLRLPEHDDWDCLDDLDNAGLVEILSTINGFVRMTPAGVKMAARVRSHKASGGHFATFRPEVAPATA